MPLILLVERGQVWALIPETSGAVLVCLAQALLDNTETLVVSHTTDSSKPRYCFDFCWIMHEHLGGRPWISSTNLKGSFPPPHPFWKPPSTTAEWGEGTRFLHSCALFREMRGPSAGIDHTLLNYTFCFSNIFTKTLIEGADVAVQQLSASFAFAEDLSSGVDTRIRGLTSIWNSSCRGATALFWPSLATTHMTYIPKDVCTAT